MHVEAIWRYPVKSMAGEQIASTGLSVLGVEGDRIIQVRDRLGRTITSRSHPALLGHKGSLTEHGEVLVDGLPWEAPEISDVIRKIAGEGAALHRDESEERFDILPLLVTTDGALKAFGRDPRRLRPNLVIGGVEGLAEREWEGRMLRIGEVVLGMHSLRDRCVMTTYDPDTQVRDIEVLRDIRNRFDGKLGLNVEVLIEGRIKVGDPVELLPMKERAAGR